MSWQFTDACLGGYPSHAGIADVYEKSISYPPYPKNLMLINEDYPRLTYLPKAKSKLFFPPYPIWLFRCLSENINNGYPVLTKLHGLELASFSTLFANEKNGKYLYLDNILLTEAFFDEKCVYNIFYNQ